MRSHLERSSKVRGMFGEQSTGLDLLLAVPSLQRRARIQPAATSLRSADRLARTLPVIWEARCTGLIGAQLAARASVPRSPEHPATPTWLGRRLPVDACSSRLTSTMERRPTRSGIASIRARLAQAQVASHQ